MRKLSAASKALCEHYGRSRLASAGFASATDRPDNGPGRIFNCPGRPSTEEFPRRQTLHTAARRGPLSSSCPSHRRQSSRAARSPLLRHHRPANFGRPGRAVASLPVSFFSPAPAGAFRTDSLVLPRRVLSMPQWRRHRLQVAKGRHRPAKFIVGHGRPVGSVAATATATGTPSRGTGKAAAAVFLRPGFIDGQAAAVEALAGQRRNRRLRLLV